MCFLLCGKYGDVYLGTVDGVAIDELYCFDTTTVYCLQLDPHHIQHVAPVIIIIIIIIVSSSPAAESIAIQHVAMGKERSREMKADGERLFLRRLSILDNCSLNLSFDDAVHSCSIHTGHNLLVPDTVSK